MTFDLEKNDVSSTLNYIFPASKTTRILIFGKCKLNLSIISNLTTCCEMGLSFGTKTNLGYNIRNSNCIVKYRRFIENVHGSNVVSSDFLHISKGETSQL